LRFCGGPRKPEQFLAYLFSKNNSCETQHLHGKGQEKLAKQKNSQIGNTFKMRVKSRTLAIGQEYVISFFIFQILK